MEQLRSLWSGVQRVLDFGLFKLRGGEFTISNLLGVLITIFLVWLVAKIIRRT